MGRGKLPLRLIPKERARRITFGKRKKGLLKKAYELSTLCDVKVCVLIDESTNQLYDHHHHHHDNHDHQYNEHQHSQIQTWPEQRHEVENIIAMYLAYKAKNPVSKKDVDLTDFFKDKIRRLQRETKKLAEENNRIMIPKSHHDHRDQHHDHDHQFELWDKRIDGFSLAQVEDLKIHLDKIISHANKHWTDRCNNMMFMCVTPHDNNYYHDHDHHQFGSSTSHHVSPMKIVMDHVGNSYETSDYQFDNFNYHDNSQFVIPRYDPHNYYNPIHYSWRHDQPSSSKSVPFDNHLVGTFMNNVPSSGSFTSMMLNNHETDYNHEDDGQYYSSLMNIGSSIFDNDNYICSGSAVISAMNDHDHHHHQHGVFLNNHTNMALQPYVMGPAYEQYPPASQFRASTSQQDVKFRDNHVVGKASAAMFSLTMD